MSRFYSKAIERLYKLKEKTSPDRIRHMERALYEIASKHPAIFVRAMDTAELSDEQRSGIKAIRELVHAERKIPAIKLHRETFGTSLRDAKEAVEKMEAEMGLTTEMRV